MALFKYGFKRMRDEAVLPDPRGELSTILAPSAIEEANNEVKDVLARGSKRAPYLKATPEMKAVVAKYASENGIMSAIRHFEKQFAPNSLKESTIRGWKNLYQAELKMRVSRKEEDLDIKVIPEKKIGRPLLLGSDLDKEVQAYLRTIRKAGCPVNTAVTLGAATGLVRRKDSNLLAANGGPIVLTRGWAQYLLNRMGYVKRKASTTAKVTVEDFASVKAQFLSDIQAFVELEEIPLELVFNWDHTGIQYVPVSNWTLEKEGTKRIEIAGLDDKRQITAIFAGNMVGEFLPPQLIYKGKTTASLPSSVKFPEGWDLTFTSNHWANETTMKAYIEKIIVPFVNSKRKQLKLNTDHRALAIVDKFKGQCTPLIVEILDSNNIDVVYVPANCTDRLQPMDLSINKPAKHSLKEKFQLWYAEQVVKQEEETKVLKPVAFPMKIMKPLGAKWLIEFYDYVVGKPEIVKNGFKAAGITDALRPKST